MIPGFVDQADFHEVDTFPSADQLDPSMLYALRLSNNTTRLTHGLHRFPAKFIPQIPAWAIHEFTGPSDTLWDPFMGSGTSLLEAVAANREGFGTDIDPLAQLITRAKVTPPSADSLEKAARAIARKWRSSLEPTLPMPDIESFEHWFTRDVWCELDGLLGAIDEVGSEPRLHDFLLAVFSSILRRVSNADDQSQKTYVSGTNPKSPPPVRDTFFRALDRARRGVLQFEALDGNVRAEVVKGDALQSNLDDGSIDLVVTSPPYLDSVDYMYNFMLEYFWLGPRLGVETRQDFNEMRRAVVGAKNPSAKSHVLTRELDDLVSLDWMGPGRRAAAITYFDLMGAHFAEAARVTREGGRYVLVIGNSQTVDGVIPVHDCLIRLAHASGFELSHAFGYRVRRHYMKFPRKGRGGIILLDWVVTLRRTDDPSSPSPGSLPLPWLTLHPAAVAN
ncbi:MAG: DNA methyltransferase [Gaiellaceae bacterium]